MGDDNRQRVRSKGQESTGKRAKEKRQRVRSKGLETKGKS